MMKLEEFGGLIKANALFDLVPHDIKPFKEIIAILTTTIKTLTKRI